MKTHPLLTRPRAGALAVALALTFGPGGLLPLGLALAAPPAPRKAASAPTVTLNFVNAEIEGVARAMAAIINRQILVDPRVKGAITLYSDQPLTPREAYLNFLAALRGQGFSLVEVAGLLKVVPEAEAKLQTGTVDVGTVKQSGDQVVTQIFRVQYESANNLVTVLRPLISPNNTINANASTNTLVITDYADNLKRIGQMIAALDVPTATDMEAIPLQYAIASDLAPVVQKLADGGGSTPGAPGGGAAGQSTMVLSDSRTNTLMVRAPNAARMALVRTLIQRLDRPGTSGLGGSGIHVVYLRNADAVKLAQVLRAAFPGAGGSSGGGASGGGASSGASGLPTSNMGGAAASGGASQQSTSPVGASAQPSTGGFIQADPSTNSLIITATDSLYKQLRAVIDQLDGRRAQIYIEAMIVEVSEQKLAEAGFQWANVAGNNNLVGVGTNLAAGNIGGLFSLVGASRSTASSLKGLSVGFAHKMSDGTYNLGALATFLETNADANILSKPNMVALDNEEAKIVVGRNVPFVTGQYTNGATSSSGTVNPFTTVERKDVGLTLRVRPQVGEGGTVRMTVFQEKSDVESQNSAQGPTTTKSSIETTVVVDDGQTLVLGGLLKDQFSNDDSQVPVLGDIPILGNLFKSRSRTRAKTNLMVFLRPVVMRSQEASNDITMDRYDYMRQRQDSVITGDGRAISMQDGPNLDPLKLSNKLSMPSVRQPLDDPNAPAPTVVMPSTSGFAPKLTPQTSGQQPAATGSK
ncbi:MAG: type II secretion system secretin GspD [Aquabacterium sp.]|uniref:type II secretion system secretin GspD n=1 Tax=Aquabacterium sp. TaxID=1872578 RepID=UPI0025BAFF62|nr:type II secretion system secretin GspD [Aquabacterium sp.]MBI3382162.1 type II secretion system secretin GspD [Aquabacterium sp.]